MSVSACLLAANHHDYIIEKVIGPVLFIFRSLMGDLQHKRNKIDLFCLEPAFKCQRGEERERDQEGLSKGKCTIGRGFGG